MFAMLWSKWNVTYPPYAPRDIMPRLLRAMASVHLSTIAAASSPSSYFGMVLTNCPGAGTYSSTASIYLLCSCVSAICCPMATAATAMVIEPKINLLPIFT